MSQQPVPTIAGPPLNQMVPHNPLHDICLGKCGEPRLCNNMPWLMVVCASSSLVRLAVHESPRTATHTKRHPPCTGTPGYTWLCINLCHHFWMSSLIIQSRLFLGRLLAYPYSLNAKLTVSRGRRSASHLWIGNESVLLCQK